VTLVQEEVREIVTGDGGPTQIVTDQSRRRVDKLVLATGAHSKPWSKQLATWLPLDSERGYHLMLPRPGVEMRVPVLYGDYRFGLVPMVDGIRLAGTAELARVDAAPSFERAERLLKIAGRLVPGLQGEGRTQWMGHRPSTPDSLPVIGRSPRFNNVFLAFGHGHLGLTLGAVTGRIIADLAAGRPSIMPLAPYDITRFGRLWSRNVSA
jgi:D-amino-acid dehydrogenase